MTFWPSIFCFSCFVFYTTVARNIYQLKTDRQTIRFDNLALIKPLDTSIKPLVENIFPLSIFSNLLIISSYQVSIPPTFYAQLLRTAFTLIDPESVKKYS